jgi:hypothetical protein
VGHKGRDDGDQAGNKCKHHAVEPMGDRFKAVIHRVESVHQPNLEAVKVCLGGEVGGGHTSTMSGLGVCCMAGKHGHDGVYHAKSIGE